MLSPAARSAGRIREERDRALDRWRTICNTQSHWSETFISMEVSGPIAPLYLFNDAMPSHERERSYLAEVIAFYKGAKPVGGK